MKLFKKSVEQPRLLEFTEPYAFEPGMRYVIQVNISEVSLEEVRDLGAWFEEQGVIVKLIAVRSSKALSPVTATRKKENYDD